MKVSENSGFPVGKSFPFVRNLSKYFPTKAKYIVGGYDEDSGVRMEVDKLFVSISEKAENPHCKIH